AGDLSGDVRGGYERLLGGAREHVRYLTAQGVDLPHQAGGDVGEGGLGEQEDGVDLGEVTVHARHGLLIGEVQLGAQSAHHRTGADLPADVDQQSHAQGARRDGVRQVLLRHGGGDGLLAGVQPQQALLAGVLGVGDVDPVGEGGGAARQVEVAEGEGVERAGQDY